MCFICLKVVTKLSSTVFMYFQLLIHPSWPHSLPVWILIFCVFHKEQKSRYYPLVWTSFLKIPKKFLLTREFEIIFQIQHFKGNKFICIKSLVLLFGKTCAEERISCLHGAKFRRGRVWSWLSGVCLINKAHVTLNSFEIKCSWKFVLLGYETGCKQGCFSSKMTKSWNKISYSLVLVASFDNE